MIINIIRNIYLFVSFPFKSNPAASFMVFLLIHIYLTVINQSEKMAIGMGLKAELVKGEKAVWYALEHVLLMWERAYKSMDYNTIHE
jgi:hypothetical protein